MTRGRATAAVVAVALLMAGAAPVVPAWADGSPSASAAASSAASTGTDLPAAVTTAMQQAKSTGSGVTVDSMTTETEQTTANPDGTLTVESDAAPARVSRNGGWVPVSATLAQNPDGTVSPAAVPGRLVLSGGGTGPLATLGDESGHSISYTLPFALPAPSLSGDTAVYSEVIPNVDLTVTAAPSGAFSTVLTVKNAAGAADPQLADLHLAVSLSSGLTQTGDATGNVRVQDASGRTVFASGAPAMWDSSTSATTMKDPFGSTPGSSVHGPGHGARRALMAVTATSTGEDLVPPASALSGPGVNYPVYLDPDTVSSTGPAWDEVQQAYPTVSNYKDTTVEDLGIGYQGYTCPCGIERAYYEFTTPNAIKKSTNSTVKVSSATLDTNETGSSSGSSARVDLYDTGVIGSGTTWNSQPSSGSLISYATAPGSVSAVSFTATSEAQAASGSSWSTITVYLRADDESNSAYFKRFGYNPKLSVTYDYQPNQPVNLATSPLPHNGNSWSCVSGGYLGKADGGGVVMKATASTPTPSTTVGLNFWLEDTTTGTYLANKEPHGYYASGTLIPSNTESGLVDGHAYSWWAQTYDGTIESVLSPTCTFTVDQTSPGPPGVASAEFPANGLGLHAGTQGTFSLSATDPGTAPSGIWCFHYVFDDSLATQAPVNTCSSTDSQTVMATGSGASGTASVTWTPPTWGTHTLQIVSVDKAGNTSTPTSYSFYALDDPNAKPSPGNLTGDGVPELLTPDSSGNLGLYQAALGSAQNGTAGSGKTIAAPAAAAPDGTSWNGWQLTHRGSVHGLYVDDLLAHKTGDPNLYVYQNDGIGHFSSTAEIPLQVSPTTGGLRCSCNFAAATAIAAIGDGDAGVPGGDYPNPGALTASLNSSDFVAVVPDAGGVPQLWLFTYKNAAAFNPGVQISAFTSANNPLAGALAVFSPGDASGDGLPDLWWEDSAGQIHQFASATKSDGSIDWANGIGGGQGSTTVGTPVSTTTYPTVTSTGDVNGDGISDLWAVDASGNVDLLPGTGTGSGFGGAVVEATTTSTTGPVLSWMLGNGHAPTGTSASSTDVVTGAGTDAAGDPSIATGYDSAGNQYPAAGTGGVYEVNAHDGGAAAFDGSTGALSTGAANHPVDTSKAFSVSLWARTSNTATGSALAGADGAQASAFVLYHGTDNTWRFGMARSDAAGWNDDIVISGAGSTDWTHLVAEFDPSATGAQMRLYVNGQLAGTAAHTGSWNASGGFVVGRDLVSGAANAFWPGQIDDVAVYNRTLSGGEVTSLYDAGKVQALTPGLLSSNDGVTTATCVADPAHAPTMASLTPTLGAMVNDSDLAEYPNLHGDFELRDVTDPTVKQPLLLGSAAAASAAGTNAAVTTPTLVNGHEYAFAVRSNDGATGSARVSPVSSTCYFWASTDGTKATATGAQGLFLDNTRYSTATPRTWVGPKSTLKWLATGNLAIYGTTGTLLWQSGTAGHANAVLTFQADGNIVVYNGQPTVTGTGAVVGKALWSTGTFNKSAANVVLQTDGNLVVYNATGTSLWASGTVQ